MIVSKMLLLLSMIFGSSNIMYSCTENLDRHPTTVISLLCNEAKAKNTKNNVRLKFEGILRDHKKDVPNILDLSSLLHTMNFAIPTADLNQLITVYFQLDIGDIATSMEILKKLSPNMLLALYVMIWKMNQRIPGGGFPGYKMMIVAALIEVYETNHDKKIQDDVIENIEKNISEYLPSCDRLKDSCALKDELKEFFLHSMFPQLLSKSISGWRGKDDASQYYAIMVRPEKNLDFVVIYDAATGISYSTSKAVDEISTENQNGQKFNFLYPITNINSIWIDPRGNLLFTRIFAPGQESNVTTDVISLKKLFGRSDPKKLMIHQVLVNCLDSCVNSLRCVVPFGNSYIVPITGHNVIKYQLEDDNKQNNHFVNYEKDPEILLSIAQQRQCIARYDRCANQKTIFDLLKINQEKSCNQYIKITFKNYEGEEEQEVIEKNIFCRKFPQLVSLIDRESVEIPGTIKKFYKFYTHYCNDESKPYKSSYEILEFLSFVFSCCNPYNHSSLLLKTLTNKLYNNYNGDKPELLGYLKNEVKYFNPLPEDFLLFIIDQLIALATSKKDSSAQLNFKNCKKFIQEKKLQESSENRVPVSSYQQQSSQSIEPVIVPHVDKTGKHDVDKIETFVVKDGPPTLSDNRVPVSSYQQQGDVSNVHQHVTEMMRQLLYILQCFVPAKKFNRIIISLQHMLQSFIRTE